MNMISEPQIIQSFRQRLPATSKKWRTVKKLIREKFRRLRANLEKSGGEGGKFHPGIGPKMWNS